MKKTFSLLFSFAIIFLLAACSNSAASEKQGETSDSVVGQPKEIQNNAQEAVEQSKVFQDAKEETERKSEETKETEEQETEMGNKILVVYFSCTGTTKLLAEYAAEILGADLYEIVAEDPYTETDLAYYTGGRADQEQNDPHSRPAISGSVENIDSYDTILIGFPIWHGQAPRIISTFLESYDFSEKTILPFCTSHSSGIGSSADDLHALCPDSVNWLEGKRSEAGATEETLEGWLGDIGFQ